ncbi:MAG TPA: M23 family metallopeptidase, partial [Devosia sp.]|nr:M23 family metallopeptidase [Devosia sp.]
AHLATTTVNKGDVVSRGDTIGTVGMTGSVTRPQLHFELRQGATPVDPIPMLAG